MTRKEVYIHLKKHIPNLLTGGNALMGMLSIISSIEGNYKYSIICILIAVVFDTFDGRLARKYGVDGDFGKEFDSLADLITFGVAPSILAYMSILQDISLVGIIVTCLLPLSGAYRLARFNSEMYKDLKTFTGVPITLAGIIICTYFVLLDVKTIPLIVLIILLSYLMNSKVRIPSFKKIELKGRKG